MRIIDATQPSVIFTPSRAFVLEGGSWRVSTLGESLAALRDGEEIDAAELATRYPSAPLAVLSF